MTVAAVGDDEGVEGLVDGLGGGDHPEGLGVVLAQPDDEDVGLPAGDGLDRLGQRALAGERHLGGTEDGRQTGADDRTAVSHEDRRQGGRGALGPRRDGIWR